MPRAPFAALVLLALGALPSLGGSGSSPTKPVLNTQHGPAASERPRRALVARFGERAGAEGAGRVAAESIGRILEARGVDVVLSDEAPETDASLLRRAREKGADAAVLGTVTQWTRREIETHGAVVKRRRTEVFVPGKQRVESAVALTVRVLQVPSGRVAYSTLAHWSTPWPGEPEAAAEKLLEAALDRWLSAWRTR